MLSIFVTSRISTFVQLTTSTHSKADWTRSVGHALNVNNDEIFLSRRLRIAASAAEYQSWISFHGLTKKYFTYYSCCIAFLIRSKHQRLNAFRADYCYAITIEWVSEQGLTSPSTHCRSFQRRVFPVNHLHWYWQPNKNNLEAENINNTK